MWILGTRLNSTAARESTNKAPCVQCGPLLESTDDGADCTTKGVFTAMINGNKRRYDLSALRNRFTLSFEIHPNKCTNRHFNVSGVRIFPFEGIGYYHLFNVTLFGDEKTQCIDTEWEPSLELPALRRREIVEAWICRTIALPNTPGANGTRKTTYSSTAV